MFGVLPGEAGLTATEVARRLRTPWKDGVLDDEQVTRAALAAILEWRRDEEHTAYNGSDGPQRRELTGDERAFLSRLAGQAAADPRWAGEKIAQRAEIRAALGDGTRLQARPLTGRERDVISRMTMLIDGEHERARARRGYKPPSPWMAELVGCDVTRLRLIDNTIWPQHGDPCQDGPVLANAADWATPEAIPDGWVIACAPCLSAAPSSGRARTWETGSSTPPAPPTIRAPLTGSGSPNARVVGR